jgi:hypothetical protein
MAQAQFAVDIPPSNANVVDLESAVRSCKDLAEYLELVSRQRAGQIAEIESLRVQVGTLPINELCPLAWWYCSFLFERGFFTTRLQLRKNNCKLCERSEQDTKLHFVRPLVRMSMLQSSPNLPKNSQKGQN